MVTAPATAAVLMPKASNNIHTVEPRIRETKRTNRAGTLNPRTSKVVEAKTLVTLVTPPNKK
jgi:hypothetical protein